MPLLNSVMAFSAGEASRSSTIFWKPPFARTMRPRPAGLSRCAVSTVAAAPVWWWCASRLAIEACDSIGTSP